MWWVDSCRFCTWRRSYLLSSPPVLGIAAQHHWWHPSTSGWSLLPKDVVQRERLGPSPHPVDKLARCWVWLGSEQLGVSALEVWGVGLYPSCLWFFPTQTVVLVDSQKGQETLRLAPCHLCSERLGTFHPTSPLLLLCTTSCPSPGSAERRHIPAITHILSGRKRQRRKLLDALFCSPVVTVLPAGWPSCLGSHTEMKIARIIHVKKIKNVFSRRRSFLFSA